MAFMDIFKKIFEQKKEEPPPSLNYISLSEIPYKTQEMLREEISSFEKLKTQAMEKIEKFKLDLEMDIRVLQNINLNNRKENEKLKLTVLDNLRLYIDYLKNLMKDLDSIKSLSPNDYLTKAEKLISNFNKNSKTAFEKATILIGEELGRTRDTVKSFLFVISGIISQSKKVNENISSISSLIKSAERVEEIKRNVGELNQANSQLNNVMENSRKKQEEEKKEIEEAKKSEEYKNSMEEKIKRAEEMKNLDARIQEIKSKIELKLLSKYFHTDWKKSYLINKYIDNFKETMKEDENLEIVNIVRDSKGIDISSLYDIRKREAELLSIPESEVDKKISLLKKEIEKQDSEIRSKEAEIESNKKKAEKLEERENEVLKELKDELEKLNLSLK